MRQWKDFCAVGERNGSFSWTVERIEEVDEESDAAKMSFGIGRDPERETRGEKGPTHVWECEE
jgi:hypothetical protein